MADEENKDGAEAAPPPKKKLPMAVVAMGLQSVLLLVGLGLVAKSTLFTKRQVLTETILKERSLASVKDDESKVQNLDLQEFLTNLPQRRALRAKIMLEVSNPETVEILNKRMPAVKAKVLRRLSGQDPSKLASVRGKLELKDILRGDLNEEIFGNDEEISGVVREVYFTEFTLK
jgi:flagellar basal body-associated protein FliL